MVIAVYVLALQASVPDQTLLGMEDAASRAIQVSPAIASATLAVRAPAGRRAEAFWPFPDNPTVEIGRIRRTGVVTTQDREWAVAQEVEIAGQWLARRSAASGEVRSAEARIDDARRLVALEARKAWVAVAIADRRAALTDSSANYAERLAQYARRLFDAGEANRLEMNAALLEAARARSSAERARALSDAAAADLGRVLATPARTRLRTTSLPPLPVEGLAPDTLLQRQATAARPDLRAADESRRAASSRVSATKRQRIPNLTVAAVGGREAGTDVLAGFVLSAKIPLFHWQQGGIGQSEADQAVAEADLATTQRTIASEVAGASARFRRARAAEQRFAAEVLRAATENVTLTERALTEGEASLTDMLVLRSSAVGAQLEYLDVLQDVYNAWLDLSAAIAVEPSAIASLGGGR